MATSVTSAARSLTSAAPFTSALTSTTNTPTPTTTTTATSATTSINATTSTSSTSSAPTSSSGSTSTTTSDSSTSSTTTTSTSSASPSQIVTSSDGTRVTITVTPTVTTTPSSKPTSNSFFSNKPAVIGVFTVVGLIVAVLVIALIVNAIRRRRAQKFDRDVAEAAAEAAASSSREPFDDYSYPNTGGDNSGGGGGGGGGYGYSDNSHGTYQLPPLHPKDTYGMTEMAQYDPYAAGAASLAAAAVGRSRSRKDSEPGTPGIAGVGAGTLAREPSRRAPYHAFAGPGAQSHELQGGNTGTLRSRRATNQDVLEAAGLVDTNAAALGNASNNSNSLSGGFVSRKPSETTQHTHMSGRSQFGSINSGHQYSQPQQPTWQSGYSVESYYPQRNDSQPADPFAGYPPTMSKPLPNPHDAAPSSSPPPVAQSNPGENRTELPSPPALRSEEQRMSYQDDADYGQGSRVLRVANA